jgi:hypothetical protein
MGVVGLEPTRPIGQQILSLGRLPIPPHSHKVFKIPSPPCEDRTHLGPIMSRLRSPDR